MERVRVEMGLDKPVIVQYINYLAGIVTRGDLGTSYKTGVPVLTEVLERLPTTMILAGISTLISVGIGVPLGIAAATWQNTLVDYAASGLSFIGVSMPNFWQGLMNILVFSTVALTGFRPPVFMGRGTGSFPRSQWGQAVWPPLPGQPAPVCWR